MSESESNTIEHQSTKSEPPSRWVMNIQTMTDRGTSTIVALCSDSSIWICQFKVNEPMEWLPLPLIPQEVINPNHTLTVT